MNLFHSPLPFNLIKDQMKKKINSRVFSPSSSWLNLCGSSKMIVSLWAENKTQMTLSPDLCFISQLHNSLWSDPNCWICILFAWSRLHSFSRSYSAAGSHILRAAWHTVQEELQQRMNPIAQSSSFRKNILIISNANDNISLGTG